MSTKKKILECSTKGDKRYSAFCAYICINGKWDSIEHFYQYAKKTTDGKIAGKGKEFSYFICPWCGKKFPAEEVSNLYKGFWIVYYNKHPELIEYARQFDGFNDIFRGKSKNCQADVIAAVVSDYDKFIAEVKASQWYQEMAKCLSSPNAE